MAPAPAPVKTIGTPAPAGALSLYKNAALLGGKWAINLDSPKMSSSELSRIVFAMNLFSQQEVALKLFKDQDVFEQERDILIRLAHPTLIVPIVDVIDEVYSLYPDYGATALVLAKAEKSLDQLINLVNLAAHEVVGLGQQITAVIAHIHSKRICWADCKPANFLMLRDPNSLTPRLVACDFASGRDFGEDLDMFATPQYCPPEFCWAVTRNVSVKAHFSFDIWSLGICLYRLMQGDEFFVSDEDALEVFGKSKKFQQKIIEQFVESRIRTITNEPAQRLLRDCLQVSHTDRPTADTLSNRALFKGGATVNMTSISKEMANQSLKLAEIQDSIEEVMDQLKKMAVNFDTLNDEVPAGTVTNMEELKQFGKGTGVLLVNIESGYVVKIENVLVPHVEDVLLVS